MWNKSYDLRSLVLDVELTSYCNLRCPQCSRTDEHNNLEKKSWLPLHSVSIDQFKNWFPPKVICTLKQIHFSGTYGDPGMCKDLAQIVDYIIDKGTCKISINTNGSMRDSDYWWDIAAKGQHRLKIILDIDGINQEMHGFYRRGSDLEKVLDVVEAISTTPVEVSVLTVLFKHNEDYLEQIRDMVRDRANKEITFDEVEGNNFQDGRIYKFKDEDGNEQQLEQVTRKDREQGLKRESRRVRDHRHIEIVELYNKIDCLAASQQNLKIQSSGQVTPCCYMSTPLETASLFKPDSFNRMITTYGGKDEDINPVAQEFIDNPDSFNLDHTPLFDIINGEWFTKTLPDSWQTKSPCFACSKVCGVV